MGTNNESDLGPVEFEGLCGDPINGKLLAAGNSSLVQRREVRARAMDLEVVCAPNGKLKL